MQHFFIRRQRTAYAGQRRLLILIRAADDGVNLKPGRGLDDAFHAVEIFNAGQLDQNLVVAQAVLLDDRLADAEGIHAVADGLDGLLDGFLFKRQLDLWLHGDGEAGV